ncbi:MAG: hypothetical protein OXH59_13615 [Rhodospirillaceae bacterium]|nr:hypothetical protein [Rhodospirillaceae bacterium]
MTRTSTARRRHSWRERAFVLGGFALAALLTPLFLALDAGADLVGAAWLAAVLWTVPSSLALALRRGFVHHDWSAFRDYELPDDTDTIDWSTKSGAWYDLALAEENERILLGN